MTQRRILWGSILTLLLLALAGAAVVVWLLARPAAPSTLLVAGDNAAIHLVDSDGTQRVLASDAVPAPYRFPAVSPDRRQLVYVGGDDDARTIVQVDIASGERTELYRSSVVQPFDLAWSLDGQHVLFLAATSAGIGTYLLPQGGAGQAELIATGSGSYFAWSQDSSRLALHQSGHSASGGRVEVYDLGGSQSQPIATDPGLFQAPAFSVDGSAIFYAAQPAIEQPQLTYAELESALVRVDADGANPTVLASEKQAGLRIIRAPNSDRVAYSVQHFARNGTFEWGALKLVEGGGEPRMLSAPDQQVAAFFWSPDGAQIAYLAYQDTLAPSSPRTWHVVDIGSGAVRELASFTASRAFLEMEFYFDAYLYSFTPWSPDGTRLTYGASDGVYVLDLASGQTTRAADGTLGMWVGG